MQKSKGISMVSLVVTIVCIILLSSMAIGIGLRYNKETRNRDEQAFIEVLSAAVSNRHEETNLDSENYHYVGYYINDAEKFESIFLPKIKTDTKFEDGIWYLIDNESADELGVMLSENYIEDIEDDYTGQVKVALVNYSNGETYIIDVDATEAKDLDFSNMTKVDGHIHKHNNSEPTCTEGVVCVECGYILKEPLGHTYGDSFYTAEPVDEYSHYRKACLRCGMQGDYEAHNLKYEHLKVENVWYHKKECYVCGWQSLQSDLCTLIYKMPEDATEILNNHIAICKYCEHTEMEAHKIVYKEISVTEHQVYCSKCNYTLRREEHVDSDKNNICDLCNYEITDYLYPVITKCTIVNNDAQSEEKKYFAKYDETIKLDFTTLRPVKNVQVMIAGKTPNKISSSSDGKEWTAEYTIENGSGILNGNISFSIMCESNSGVTMQNAQTTTTDGKYVVFDGNSPVIEYINKAIRALTNN